MEEKKQIDSSIRCPVCGQHLANFKSYIEHQKSEHSGEEGAVRSDQSSGFVHCHTHSEYSILDGLGPIGGLVKKAAEDGAKALVLTDHGTLSGHIAFQDACIQYGVKPIFGCEFYVSSNHLEKTKERTHLILIAKNAEGYQNLLYLASEAAVNGFYYKPRIDKKMIEEHSEGLICSSACTSGEIQKALIEDDFDSACDIARWYQDVFGDDFYLEMQPNRLPQQKKANIGLIRIAQKYKMNILVTNDAHYPYQEDWKSHEVLLCIKSHKSISDPKRFRFDDNTFWLMTEEEIREAFRVNHSDIPETIINEGIENSLKIADQCDYTIAKQDVVLPIFKLPEGFESDSEFLEHLAREGIEKEYVRKKIEKYARLTFPEEEMSFWMAKKVYYDRLNRELKVVHSLGFERYLLIVWDIYEFCRRDGIIYGPGRGSVAGSLLAYCIGITTVDPIENDLLFERFLNPARIDMPDVDMDFEDSRRWEVVRHLKNTYGEDHVSNIVTFGKLKGKLVLKDIARVFDVPYEEVNRVTGFIIERSGGDARTSFTVADTIESFDEMKKFAEKYPEVIRHAKRMEGMIRQKGMHAAGIVVSERPISESCPIEAKDGVTMTSFDHIGAENLGLLKLDVLGLRTMSIIGDTIKKIEEKTGERPALEEIPLDDEEVFRQFTLGMTTAVFQLETPNMTKLCRQVGVEKFGDLVQINALGRPGTMRAGVVPRFIQIKHGKRAAEYSHPLLKPITEDTYSIMLYQEQIMKILADIGRFQWSTVDLQRKIISKSQGTAAFEKARAQFVEGAIITGMTEEDAHNLYTKMIQFGSYSFNKCLVGDTVIQRHDNKRITIEHLYKVKTDKNYAKETGHVSQHYSLKRKGYGKILSVCEDGKIRPNKIVDIFQNGEKEVWKLKTEDKEIEATLDHRLLTKKGWKTLSEIKIGDMIAIKGGREKAPYNGEYNFYKEKMPLNSEKGKEGFRKRENGQSVIFKKHRSELFLKFGMHCMACMNYNVRIETHHKDGDRTNNEKENLINLCPSCHKKADYALGRNKQYSKGICVDYQKVLRKELIGNKMTYDIEMEAPNHNFIANGFVSHNSHAAAYSTISYWCQYFKVYYPNEFFAAALSNSGGREYNYIREARKFGVVFNPPDINKSDWGFSVDGEEILCGLHGVAGLGDKGIQYLQAQRPFQDLADFLRKVPRNKVQKKAVAALIRIGAFGDATKGGAQSLKEFDGGYVQVNGQKTLFDFGGGATEFEPDWTEEEISEFQNQYYILPPANHPIEAYEEFVRSLEVADSVSMIEEVDPEEMKGKAVWLRGVITQITYQNWGDKLAEKPQPGDPKYNYYRKFEWDARHCLFNLEDETGLTLISIDPEIFKKVEPVINKGTGTPVLVKGTMGWNLDRFYGEEVIALEEFKDKVENDRGLSAEERNLVRNPLRDFVDVPNRINIGDLEENGRVIGILGQPKIKIDKNGNEMAIVPLEDLTGGIDLIMFSGEWAYRKSQISKGKVVGALVEVMPAYQDRKPNWKLLKLVEL